jgi:hypothetical protein
MCSAIKLTCYYITIQYPTHTTASPNAQLGTKLIFLRANPHYFPYRALFKMRPVKPKYICSVTNLKINTNEEF